MIFKREKRTYPERTVSTITKSLVTLIKQYRSEYENPIPGSILKIEYRKAIFRTADELLEKLEESVVK